MTLISKETLALLKRYPVAIGSGALSLALLVAVYFRSESTSDLARKLHDNEDQGKKILADIRNGASLAEQFETMANHTKDLDGRLMRGSERARNQQYFYRLESESGVKEISLQAGGRATYAGTAPSRGAPPRFIGVPYTISVQGDYRQLLDFLGRIESGQHFARLNGAMVGRAGQRNAGTALTLTMNVEFLGVP